MSPVVHHFQPAVEPPKPGQCVENQPFESPKLPPPISMFRIRCCLSLSMSSWLDKKNTRIQQTASEGMLE